jgi:hypothetical protein
LTKDFTCGCVGYSAHVWTLVKKFLQGNITQIPPGNRFTNHLTVIAWKQREIQSKPGNLEGIPPGN